MKKSYIWLGVTLVVIALLLGWGRLSGVTRPVTFWNGTTIQCLPNGHANLAMHIHQDLKISVNGEPEAVPTNLGISHTCMAEVHTHDATGKLHEESASVGRQFKLADFFTVWGKTIEREGYTLDAFVNGTLQSDPSAIILVDGQIIELAYRSAASTTTE